MNIGEEEEAIEVPMPLAPGKQQPIHEPSPQVEPVKEPAHAEYDGVIDGVVVIDGKRYVMEMKSHG
jgi:hypothetical protein